MGDVILKVEGLSTHFGYGENAVRAVDEVSFEIRQGETFALLGESGCGKSMTSLSLMRLVPPAGRIVAGRVMLGAQDLTHLPESAMRRVRGGRMAMIFQDPMTALNPVISAGEQIAEAVRWHRGSGRDEARRVALELLDAVGIADAVRRYREYPHQLSGGMKQRVMIAMALAGEPELLIADEPTTALDVTIQAQVLALLKDLQRARGMSIMLITHDLGVVAETADRVAVMYAGRIVEQAARDAFFACPRHPYSRKLFESLPDLAKRHQRLAVIAGSMTPVPARSACRFAGRCEFVWERCRDAEPALLPVVDEVVSGTVAVGVGADETGAGHGVRCHLYDPVHADRLQAALRRACVQPVPRHRDDIVGAGPLLAVEDLKVHFPLRHGVLARRLGMVRAVDGVSFALERGRTLALVGESGCGKTTVGKAILRLVSPLAGTVRFDGSDLAALTGEALRRRRGEFQIVFQDAYASMNPRMRVGEIVAEGMITLGLEADPRRRAMRAEALLAEVGLPPDAARRYPHEFSGGQRQRICIARALAVEPRLIVCDEPTSALDISVQAQILNLLQSLQDSKGISYLFITHNLSVVAYLADEVAVMYLGRIVERGRIDEVLTGPRHPYTQALLAAVPRIDGAEREKAGRLPGDLPSPASPPAGCHFHTRCPQAMAQCRDSYPVMKRFSSSHGACCHLY